MERKYEFTGETKEFAGHLLHRIRAVRDFVGGFKGMIGGWIEKETNLSHYGACWVGDEAMVYEDGGVYENARIYGCAQVHGSARVHGDAHVIEHARIFENATIDGCAVVRDYSRVHGNASVYGEVVVFGDARLSGSPEVAGNVKLSGNVVISGNACLECQSDYVYIENSALPNWTLTYTRPNREWETGRGHGTAEELVGIMREDGYDERRIKCFEIIADAVERMYGIMEAKE